MKIAINWGFGVALVYTAFAAATLAFVAFAMARPVDLVSPDYYAQSLRQDERMQGVRNVRALGGAAGVEQPDARTLVVRLPESHAARAQGTVTLYRASDASADRQVPLQVDGAGRQAIALDGLQAGHWTVKVQWTADDRAFYLECEVIAR